MSGGATLYGVRVVEKGDALVFGSLRREKKDFQEHLNVIIIERDKLFHKLI